MQYFIMTTAMTLRRLGCALCMPFISPFRSPFRPYNRAYAYRGLTAFAPLSMAVSERRKCFSLPLAISMNLGGVPLVILFQLSASQAVRILYANHHVYQPRD
ncbi:MAG: hypothetical protein KZQ60_14690 [Candidatus Thiodiazotropha sp. (ex Lucinoma aequizonata)]|nr:hypothetical protein [Candidatus Thiodiazotropha sp. (ex Lucinoma aequizonata)]